MMKEHKKTIYYTKTVSFVSSIAIVYWKWYTYYKAKTYIRIDAHLKTKNDGVPALFFTMMTCMCISPSVCVSFKSQVKKVCKYAKK